jgi:hypothetical protein
MTRIGPLALIGLAGCLAHVAWAQTNPALRGSATTPRVAQQDRVAPAVAQFLVNELSPFAADCGDRNGTLYINAEVEPHIAVNPLNPDNLVASWQQDRYSNGAARGLVSAASFDGGRTWTRSTLPLSACTNGEYARATDPWVAFSPDGTAHQIALALTGGTFGEGSVNAMLASRSRDGGLTWSTPIPLIRDGVNLFNDKETMTADPHDARFVYAVWDRLAQGGGGPAIFARTTDGGITWEAARAIYDPGPSSQTIGNLIQVLPDGTLVNMFARLGGPTDPSINVIRSTDRGASWSAPIRVASFGVLGARDPTTNAPIRDGGILPEMAVAPDGALYVVWQDARFTQARDAIAISRSIDGGLTWSTPVRVNGDPSVWAFTPQVHVRSDGTIGVTYYDLRSDTSDTTTLLTDFWISRSSDGLNWTETRIASAFDLDIAPNAGGYFLGDYTGLVSAGTTFIAFYARTTGNAANRNDLYLARIAPGAGATRAAKRAQPMPAGDPGADFWRAVRENAQRAVEKRLARFATGEPRAAVR